MPSCARGTAVTNSAAGAASQYNFARAPSKSAAGANLVLAGTRAYLAHIGCTFFDIAFEPGGRANAKGAVSSTAGRVQNESDKLE
jgi:hypothetical protein